VVTARRALQEKKGGDNQDSPERTGERILTFEINQVQSISQEGGDSGGKKNHEKRPRMRLGKGK